MPQRRERRHHFAPFQVWTDGMLAVLTFSLTPYIYRFCIQLQFSADSNVGNVTCHFPALGCIGSLWLQPGQRVREVALRPHHQCHTGCGGPTDWPVCSPQRWVCGYLLPITGLCRTKLGRHLLHHHSSNEPHCSNHVMLVTAFLLDYIEGTVSNLGCN